MNACAHISKTIIVKLLSGLLMLLSSSVLSAEFVIVGVPKKLEQNLQAHLAPLENVAVRDIKSNQVQTLINSAMMPFGYYHSASKITAKSTSKLTLEITKGERVTIAHTDIVISGSATTDPEFNKLIKQRSLAEGEGLDHQAMKTSKVDYTTCLIKEVI